MQTKHPALPPLTTPDTPALLSRPSAHPPSVLREGLWILMQRKGSLLRGAGFPGMAETPAPPQKSQGEPLPFGIPIFYAREDWTPFFFCSQKVRIFGTKLCGGGTSKTWVSSWEAVREILSLSRGQSPSARDSFYFLWNRASQSCRLSWLEPSILGWNSFGHA